MKDPAGTVGALALSLISLTACKPAAEAPPASAPAAPPVATMPVVFDIMARSITLHSNKLWELAGNLYADNGELDAQRLTDAQWQELTAAATALRDDATLLAEATAVRVAPDGAKLQNDGAPGALGVAQVQALIDGDAMGFKEEAAKLAAVASAALAAAGARDATKLDDASNRMNDVCAACHNRFWYPNQPG
jgi:hypothetical protein